MNPSQWSKPTPLGAGSSLDGLASVAAPPLAGFSLATTAVIAQSADSFRWPGLSMLFCVLSSLFFVFAIQAGSVARSFFYSPADLASWWQGMQDNSELREWLREQHSVDYSDWQRWSLRSRYLYTTGTVVMALSLGAIAAPPTGSKQEFLRWVVTAAAASVAALITINAIQRSKFKFISRS